MWRRQEWQSGDRTPNDAWFGSNSQTSKESLATPIRRSIGRLSQTQRRPVSRGPERPLAALFRRRASQGLPLELLRKIVSWRLRHGARALDLSTRRRLAQLVHHYTTNSPLDGEYRPHLDSGDVLKREWRGTVHRVAVDSHGYTYDGILFGSLSEVARKITGTRWLGPRFFGLERKLVSSPRGSSSHV